MSLAPGTPLGPYEILSALGAGGMGEVYLARDGKLERQVAIKVLPTALTCDVERIARFEREARLLASLNHANIASIHGFDDIDGTRFLVMEYVEGVTLGDQLKSGGFDVDEALDVARQMAEGLEAAHGKGIIHRDLKPGNVMIRPDGCVKILDFGLAKVMEDEGSGATSTDSPTITAAYTQPGVVLGTAAYMSPEQARGHALDPRTDIWSFGVIVYECLTGKPLFRGATAHDSVGAIMHKEPDWSLLPASVPSNVRLFLSRCLAKDRRRRLQAIGDARVELEDRQTSAALLGSYTTPGQAPRRAAMPWVLSGLCLLVTVIALWRGATQHAPPIVSRARRSSIALEPGMAINWRGTKDTWSKMGFSQLLAISRDGRRQLFTVQEEGSTNLYLKDELGYVATRVAGTAGARGPFLSPDGLWVGFLAEKNILKVRLPGGTPQPICEVNSTAFDATWLEDGTIVYSTDFGLRRVSAGGGTPEVLTSIDIDAGIRGHHFPHAIAGTSLIIYTVTTAGSQHAAVLSLDDGLVGIVKQHATNAHSVAGRFLVFARGGELFASSYDPSAPMTVGVEMPIVRGVHTTPGLGGAVVHLFATSDSGTLLYAPQADPPEPDTLLWVNHQGTEQPIVQGPGRWMHQRLSPDGQQILINILASDGMFDLHVYDLERRQFSALTRNGNTYDAEWSPDGRTVGYAALDTRGRSVYLMPVDFSHTARKLIDGADSRPHFSQWSRNGSTLVFFDRSSRGGIWTTPAHGGEELRELLNTSLGEGWARISPDGTLVAYVGWEAERRDVYVRAYPELGPRQTVSQSGGGEPLWASDSRTLYFREAGKIFKARITTEPELDVAEVTTLPFEDLYDAAASGHQHYDLSVDGTQFLMVKHGRQFHPSSLRLIENWPADVQDSSMP